MTLSIDMRVSLTHKHNFFSQNSFNPVALPHSAQTKQRACVAQADIRNSGRRCSRAAEAIVAGERSTILIHDNTMDYQGCKVLLHPPPPRRTRAPAPARRNGGDGAPRTPILHRVCVGATHPSHTAQESSAVNRAPVHRRMCARVSLGPVMSTPHTHTLGAPAGRAARMCARARAGQVMRT